MNRAKHPLLIAISFSVFILLLAVQSIPAQVDDDARWDDGFGFSTSSQFPFTSVRAIAVNSSGLYVGGRAFPTDSMIVNGIVRWDGSKWSNVGGGVELCAGICLATVYALEVKGDDLYVGGNFLYAGGAQANKIARWDGSKWSSLGSGPVICDRFNDCIGVEAIAISGNDVYTVGNIITDVKQGGTILNINGFARWDGSQWSAVGGGVTGDGFSASINAIATNGSDTYVGGNFTLAGFTGVNHIARWDGSQWSQLGSGIDGCASCPPYVFTLATKGNDLYAGGRFNSAGAVPANNIAKWDGSSWHALGIGANGPVYKIAFNGDDIYVGGDFTSIGGVKANGIARYDGSKWSALGSGVNGRIQAIAFKDNEVYVGGVFTSAGGKTAYNFARWVGPAIVPPPPPPVILPKITGAEIVRKKLIVTGERFDQGAAILLNGERQKTKNDDENPAILLVAKKSGRKARPGDRLRVQNPDGKLSPEFIIAQ
jgi:hypothetical protein